MPNQPEKLKVLGTHIDEHGTTVTTVVMPDRLRIMLDQFHWRMAEAERLLSDEQYFRSEGFTHVTYSQQQLIKAALSAYLRENRD